MDIKTRPQMDKPKVKNHDFVPKEAGNIWKHHHEQQEAQRGPKERGSVQYATDKVESTGKRTVSTAVKGGRRALQTLKQRNEHGRARARLADETMLHDSPQNYPSARRYSGETVKNVPQNHTERVNEQFCAGVKAENHTFSDVANPRTSMSNNAPPQQTRMEQGRQKAVRDAVKARQATKAETQDFSRQTTIKSVEEQLHAAAETENHIFPDVANPRTSKPNNAPPQQIRVEQGRRKAIWDATRSRKTVETVGKPAFPDAKVDLPCAKVRQGRAGATALRKNRPKTANFKAPAEKAGAKAAQMARHAANNRMRQRLVRQSAGTARRMANWATTAAKAAIGTAKAAASSLAAAVGGGIAALIVLALVVLVGAIAASPFGIFLSNESNSPDAVPISAAISEVTFEFNAALEALQNADTYDGVTVVGGMADWVEVLAIFAVKTAGSDVDATDVVTMDADRVNRLKTVFADMNAISSTVETIDHPDSDPDDDTDDSWTEKILHITITAKTAADMEAEYHFNTQQHTAVEELLSQRELITELIGNLTAISADATEVLRNLPEDLSPERREVIKTACSLVGKVNYFWGGCALFLDNLRRNTQ